MDAIWGFSVLVQYVEPVMKQHFGIESSFVSTFPVFYDPSTSFQWNFRFWGYLKCYVFKTGTRDAFQS